MKGLTHNVRLIFEARVAETHGLLPHDRRLRERALAARMRLLNSVSAVFLPDNMVLTYSSGRTERFSLGSLRLGGESR